MSAGNANTEEHQMPTYKTIVSRLINGEWVTVEDISVQTAKGLDWVKTFAEKRVRINRPDLRDGDLRTEAWVAIPA